MKRSKTTTKFIIISTVLALVSMLIISSALANPEDLNGQVLSDFSADTINNTTFTLSESLKTHDLVLINFWATWCGPCRMEFPGLEMAWEQYSDRVDVIALSIEKTDTFDKLTEFAGENNLEFLIGRDDSRMFDSMGGTAIPTTIIVDKDRRVVAIEIGAKTSVEDFTSLFDSLLNTSEDSACVVVDQPIETANPEENTWLCSICHALNSNDDAFCTNCAQSRRCPKCGSSVPLDDRYCSICGEEVEGWKKPDSREVLDTEEACDCNCRKKQNSVSYVELPNSFIDAMNALIDDSLAYVEIEDRLIFVVNYVSLSGTKIDDLIMLDQYEEELSKYSSVIFLMVKDDKVYLASEFSLTDGKLSAEADNILMSTEYLIEAAHIGR